MKNYRNEYQKEKMSSNNNTWINSTKTFARQHNISYGQALSNSSHRMNYHNGQSIQNGMLPTYLPQVPTRDHSGYEPTKDTKVMQAYANLAKTYNKKPTGSGQRYYV